MQISPVLEKNFHPADLCQDMGIIYLHKQQYKDVE